eukprot:CAMPEP_0119323288 /NCGR_PEP_ID=MMETSP1333-20130426/60414_1 /TAXON_ID=418940 /ORGANISM="Scyphosphaera apsteinii, Strain RCC1455" /LENGTH=888 /DNA_ID=CAMNT_0007330693 /DNA_START=234 /DNA_END=2897 /DNA_ORIENTATION=-
MPFWDVWESGAREAATAAKAKLTIRNVGNNATAAALAIAAACNVSDSLVVTIPYAEGTSQYEMVDDAINACLITFPSKPIYSSNTGTYHNVRLYGYVGIEDYSVGLMCARQLLFGTGYGDFLYGLDVVMGRDPSPERPTLWFSDTFPNMSVRVVSTREQLTNPGLQMRFQGLHDGLHAFGAQPILSIDGEPDGYTVYLTVSSVVTPRTAPVQGLICGDEVLGHNSVGQQAFVQGATATSLAITAASTFAKHRPWLASKGNVASSTSSVAVTIQGHIGQYRTIYGVSEFSDLNIHHGSQAIGMIPKEGKPLSMSAQRKDFLQSFLPIMASLQIGLGILIESSQWISPFREISGLTYIAASVFQNILPKDTKADDDLNKELRAAWEHDLRKTQLRANMGEFQEGITYMRAARGEPNPPFQRLLLIKAVGKFGHVKGEIHTYLTSQGPDESSAVDAALFKFYVSASFKEIIAQQQLVYSCQKSEGLPSESATIALQDLEKLYKFDGYEDAKNRYIMFRERHFRKWLDKGCSESKFHCSNCERINVGSCPETMNCRFNVIDDIERGCNGQICSGRWTYDGVCASVFLRDDYRGTRFRVGEFGGNPWRAPVDLTGLVYPHCCGWWNLPLEEGINWEAFTKGNFQVYKKEIDKEADMTLVRDAKRSKELLMTALLSNEPSQCPLFHESRREPCSANSDNQIDSKETCEDAGCCWDKDRLQCFKKLPPVPDAMCNFSSSSRSACGVSPTPPAQACVTLYENGDFSGWSANFPIGDYPGRFEDMGGANDEVSSIRVAPGCFATLYADGNFKGWSAEFSAGDYDLSAFQSKGAINNQATSMKVSAGPTQVWRFSSTVNECEKGWYSVQMPECEEAGQMAAKTADITLSTNTMGIDNW